ncbi:MAG: diguanylate cyclase, partial [Phycisphaerales bacterium]
AGTRILTLQHELALEHRVVHKANDELACLSTRLQRVARTDELTGLANHKEAIRCLEEHWIMATQYDQPFSCIMLDIDHFKRCNDAYGHNVGDAVLRATAGILRMSSRKEQTVCRLGGEEFLILCPSATAPEAAVGAERLRQAVESNRIIRGDVEVSVAVSAGVAERDHRTESPEDLLKRADEALCTAKRAGRNRVCLAGGSPRPDLIGPGHDSASLVRPPTTSHDVADAQVKVLIADDNGDDRAFCRTLLEREGHDVTEAVDGLDALAKVNQSPPDIIIMDLMMPNLNGLQCTRCLKGDPATHGIPVIMASAAAKGADVVASLEAGVDEFIAKPIRPKEFVLRVQSMARLSRGKAEFIRSNELRGEHARALSVLADLSWALAAAGSLERVLDSIIAAAAELTRCRRVSIMLPDKERDYLTIARSIGIDSSVASAVRVPAGEGIAGQVFLTGDSALFNTHEATPPDTRFYGSEPLPGAPLLSKALAASNRVVGVLNIAERHGGNAFDAAELEYVNLLSNMAASAIEEFVTREARDQARESVVIALATLAEYRDTDTGRHLDRVTRYALLLTDELQNEEPFAAEIDDEFPEDLRRAMPLHDVGKVVVPDHILLKPDKLTPAEWEIMRRHAEVGAETLRSVIARTPAVRFLKMAEQIARSHHEWYNGKGYPQALSGEDIPLPARIAALADVYDALTTQRPYKDAFSHEAAVNIIRGASGSQFDPAVVDAFLKRQAEFASLAIQLADNLDSADLTQMAVSS